MRRDLLITNSREICLEKLYEINEFSLVFNFFGFFTLKLRYYRCVRTFGRQPNTNWMIVRTKIFPDLHLALRTENAAALQSNIAGRARWTSHVDSEKKIWSQTNTLILKIMKASITSIDLTRINLILTEWSIIRTKIFPNFTLGT